MKKLLSVAAFALVLGVGALSGPSGNVEAAKGGQEKVVICHKGETITVATKAAEKHLAKHDGDTKGACPVVAPKPSPSPSPAPVL